MPISAEARKNFLLAALPDLESRRWLYVTENGASAEIAMVGNEGLVGVSLFMGGESTSGRAVVQSARPKLPIEGTVYEK
jgi:hypothetical protein